MADEQDDDDAVDAYYSGWEAYYNGDTLPFPPGPLANAWNDGLRDATHASKVEVVMPARPEGYYHSRLEDGLS